MKKLLQSLFILLFVATSAMAQERTITGTVTSKEDKLPIPGVSVKVKGTKSGTVTGSNGKYSVQVPAGATELEFTYLGFERLSKAIGGSTVDVVLSPDSKVLTEVVVTALGIKRQASSLGYATQIVKGDEVAQKSDPNLLNTLQGKVTGVNITSSSGAPGSSTNINIRGVTSFNGNNQPLIVVDGIIFNNGVDNTQNTLFGSQPSGRLSDVDPESIATINVLKGPAASVLYGSRASAGVIVITTKDGSGMKGKTEVTFSSSLNLQNASYLPKFQNEYGQGTQNNFVENSTNSWGPKFGTMPTVTTSYAGVVPYQAYPNNIKDFYKQGSILQNSLNIAGGDKDKNFVVNLGSTLQSGIIDHSKYQRHNVQVGGNTKLRNGIKLGGTITYVKSFTKNTIAGNGGSAFGQISRIPRSYDLSGAPYKNDLGNSIYFLPGQNHPKWSLENEYLDNRIDRVFGNTSISYDIADWINVGYRITADVYQDDKNAINRLGAARNPGGLLGESGILRGEYNGDLLINMKKNNVFTDGLNASLLLGQNINQRTLRASEVVAEGLVIPGFDNVSNGTVFTNSSATREMRRLVGHYAQLSLDYKSYLFMELSGRADMSSTLPTNKNTYFYPSVAVSFVPTEVFNIKSDVLSYLKIRGNVARVGRDADPYLLNSVYVKSSYGNNTASINFPMSIGGNSIPGFGASTRIGSPDLGPEFVTSYEGGFNIGLLKSRVSVDFTYFDTRSTNQIFNVAVSNSSGYDTRTTNIGEMRNRGIELQLNATPVRSSDFSWDVSMNFTRIRNKVLSIDEGVDNAPIAGNAFVGINPSIKVGYPYGVIISTANARTPNGELLVNGLTGAFAPGVPNSVVMSPQKDYTLGISNRFTYKGLTLSALFDINKGGQIYSFGQTDMRGGGQIEMTAKDRDQPRILPGVIANGDGTYRKNNIQVSAQTYWAGLGGLASEGAVFDATSYRLREVGLAYSLPAKLLTKTPFGQVSLGFSARNLWLFAPGFPQDPETNSSGAGNIQGVDFNGMPSTKNYGFNLKVTF
ncbi:SusC/RagA family TonB-linked outer membrane protein [Pedobacter sp. KBW06]|uniref:SusC/RagA family TonB-linked outer membrane protein n=1 Tax=Pedobacter sp. KBW06 TaxID=2153359 RepID=UPI000F59BAE9|nr:SusC/RagA family TonB-linked outer membrane protein [Pedobacter sp. KBW06]RQO68016.1 SusC/RagA family TonB-linked outer membrane protein [Pedobacter sp. KBW06]